VSKTRWKEKYIKGLGGGPGDCMCKGGGGGTIVAKGDPWEAGQSGDKKILPEKRPRKLRRCNRMPDCANNWGWETIPRPPEMGGKKGGRGEQG